MAYSKNSRPNWFTQKNSWKSSKPQNSNIQNFDPIKIVTSIDFYYI